MTRTRKIALVLAAAPLAIGGALACGGAGSEPKASDTFAPTLPPAAPKPAASGKAAGKPAKPTITDGTWVVVEDVPAGIYKVNQPVESGCYWAILKAGTNGGDILSNGLPAGGRPKVTIKKGQEFETRDCGTWTKVG